MTYNKITETEFSKWSQQLKQIYDEFLKNSTFESPTIKDEFTSVGATICFFVKRGVIQATLTSMAHLEDSKIDAGVPLKALGGLTFLQWEEKTLQRIKEHCIANGYYDPNSPPDLTLLKERRDKVNKLLKDNDKLYSLLIYADREEQEIINNTIGFFDNIAKFMPNDKNENDVPHEIGFFVADHVGRVEKLINKKNTPTSPSSNSPTSKPNSPQYKDTLEAEIKRLQDQIKELEEKIKDTTNPTEKKIIRIC